MSENLLKLLNWLIKNKFEISMHKKDETIVLELGHADFKKGNIERAFVFKSEESDKLAIEISEFIKSKKYAA